MPDKLQYLRDLSENPSTSAAEAAARLETSESAVQQAYRRAQKQGLCEATDDTPRLFTLTDAGEQRLRVLSGAPQPGSAPEPSEPESEPSPESEERFDALQADLADLRDLVSDLSEDVTSLFALVDEKLIAQPKPARRLGFVLR